MNRMAFQWIMYIWRRIKKKHATHSHHRYSALIHNRCRSVAHVFNEIARHTLTSLPPFEYVHVIRMNPKQLSLPKLWLSIEINFLTFQNGFAGLSWNFLLGLAFDLFFFFFVYSPHSSLNFVECVLEANANNASITCGEYGCSNNSKRKVSSIVHSLSVNIAKW